MGLGKVAHITQSGKKAIVMPAFILQVLLGFPHVFSPKKKICFVIRKSIQFVGGGGKIGGKQGGIRGSGRGEDKQVTTPQSEEEKVTHIT